MLLVKALVGMRYQRSGPGLCGSSGTKAGVSAGCGMV